jgi:hypothetical protein
VSGNDQPEPYSLFSPVTQMFLIFLAQNVGYNEEINLIHSKLDAEELQTTRMLVNAHIDPGILFKTALELTKKCDGESSFREGEISIFNSKARISSCSSCPLVPIVIIICFVFFAS